MSLTSTPKLLRTKNFSNEICDDNNHYSKTITSKCSDDSCLDIPDPKINTLLAWYNLRYESRGFPFYENKVILKRLNGTLEYHTLNGFMGPSGAGKTTLLNCLNGNLSYGLTRDSEIFLNKFERELPRIGFIEQHVNETINGRLTVKEILYYAFLFKNGWKCKSRMLSHIESIINELMLDVSVLKNRFDKCSGGEQKRIAVAQELMSLAPPSLLFIDEPTTGLDSTAAFIVTQCLKKLTIRYRMSVVISIHAPNADMIQLFDKLYILAKGGVCIYSGSPEKLQENLKKELDIDIMDERPPIEQYLKIGCNGIENDQVRVLANKTLELEHQKVLAQISNLDFLPWGTSQHLKSFSIEDFLLQLYRLFRLVFVIDWHIFFVQIILFTTLYTLLIFVFDKDKTRPSGCYSLTNNNITCSQQLDDNYLMETYVNFQAFSIMISGFSMVGIGAIVFSPLLKIFRNEHRNRWYSMGTFFWSYLFVRFIEMNIYTLLNTFLFYFLNGHHLVDNMKSLNWNRFIHFLGMFWANNIYMQSVGHLAGIVFLDKVEILLLSANVFYTILCLLNGYLIQLEHMNNPILLKIANILASNVISKGLLWSFYGLDRCDQEGYFSSILYKYYVNPDTIYTSFSSVGINTLIIRIMTIIVLFLRFYFTWQLRPMVQSVIKKPQPIDYPTLKKALVRTTPPFPRRIKHDNELEFEEFARDKIIVAWRNLTLFGSSSIYELRSAKENQKKKLILRDLNGQFCFGTMNAVMGVSGAGKTSLLKVLNGELKTRLSNETKIYLSRFTPIRICYLTQEVSGHLLPGLTAKQSLIYASRLKNAHYTLDINVDHEQVALNLLEELDITETAETLVQNCSGGERKRLALALELTSMLMPNLICIDEPTSGLDSNSSEIVMSCLREFVHRHNITIIASIHQPNTDLMNMFDQIYVLARGGVCIYFGPPFQIRQHLAEIFEGQLLHEGRRSSVNFPVEELIKYSCMNYDEPLIQKLVLYNNHKINKTNMQVEAETKFVADGIQMNRIRFSLKSLAILCSRYFISIRGSLWHQWTTYLVIYISYAVILLNLFDSRIALADGCISLEDDFYQACNQTEENIQKETDLTSNGRYTFFAFSIYGIFVMLQCGLGFLNEMKFFFNEHRNGWYSTGVFYLTRNVYESILMTIIITCYLWIIDIYESIHPGIYWWMFLLMNLGVQGLQGLSHFLCLLANANSLIFILLCNLSYTLMLITANFFSKITSLHVVFQVISNFSTYRFMLEGTMILQYGFGRCGDKQIQAVLYNLGIYHDEYLYHCISMLLFHIILYRLLAFAALLAKFNPLENRRRRAERIMKHHTLMKSSNAIIPGMSSHLEFRIKQIHI